MGEYKFKLPLVLGLTVSALCGCATVKDSDTARTGVEQLLISSAVDRSLDKVDLSAARGAKVFVDPTYLDCVDKNYVLISLRQRLLANNCTLVSKAEDSDVTIEVGSGAVGTDRQDLFAGVPQIPLPPPSPISIPKMTIFERTKNNGTAKLIVLAYDSKSKQPIINPGVSLARSDQKEWKVVGGGPWMSGSVPKEIELATGVSESGIPNPGLALRSKKTTAR
jgi:hypothetical protein